MQISPDYLRRIKERDAARKRAEELTARYPEELALLGELISEGPEDGTEEGAAWWDKAERAAGFSDEIFRTFGELMRYVIADHVAEHRAEEVLDKAINGKYAM